MRKIKKVLNPGLVLGSTHKGTFIHIMEDQCALKPALWQTSLFRLQNVKLMMISLCKCVCLCVC